MNGRAGFLAIALLLTVGSATTLPRAEEVKDVSIELVDLKPEKASLAGFEWDAHLRVTNPNPFDLHIDFLEVGLEVGKGNLGTGSAKDFTVKKYDTKEVKLRIHTSSFGIASAVLDMVQSKNFAYGLSTDVTYKTQEGPHPRHLENRGAFRR